MKQQPLGDKIFDIIIKTALGMGVAILIFAVVGILLFQLLKIVGY